MNKSNISKKKILIISILVILALIALMYLTILIFDKSEEGSNGEITAETVLYSDFESPDYDYNIYEDSEYSEILSSEFIKFHDEYTNVTLGITGVNDAYSNGDEIGLLTEYVYSIIDGNSEKYNSFFSNAYYEDHEPMDTFTMQKIYDVVITRKIQKGEDSSGENYTKYFCALEYKILDNNGTFRKDIKDGYRTQYFIITDREGKLLIDDIYT